MQCNYYELSIKRKKYLDFFFNKSFPFLWQKSIKSAGGKYLYFGGRPVLFHCKEAHQWKNYALNGRDDAITPESMTCPTSEHNTLACKTIVKKTAVSSAGKSLNRVMLRGLLCRNHTFVACIIQPFPPRLSSHMVSAHGTRMRDTVTRFIPPDLERIFAHMLHFIFSDNIPDPV